MNKIIFVLPPEKNIPFGGYKIVYEYANRLTSRGWEVSIGYDCRNVGKSFDIKMFRNSIVHFVSELRRICYPKWFCLSDRVRKFCIYDEKDIPVTDNIVATAYETADLVAKMIEYNRLYLVQGYETWENRTEEEVNASFRLGMKNIVIAKWLKNIVDKSCDTDNSILISNGIDLTEFSLYNPIELRKEKKISMLYHQSELKGSKYGIEVLKELKKMYPELKAVLFGIPKRPCDLPDWIEYVQNATSKQLKKIYNESQIFLYPTIEEGFGLTCVESMACGCALCATNYLGVHELL